MYPMKEFMAASKAAIVQDENGDVPILEFSLDDQEFRSNLITPGQIGLIVSSDGTSESLRTLWQVLKTVLQGDGYTRLRRLVAEGTVSTALLFGGDEENEEGILDWLVQESVSNTRPTTPSTDSSPSRTTGGRRSTGRAPGKGSTLSISPSEDS